jgi:hypothetical protein
MKRETVEFKFKDSDKYTLTVLSYSEDKKVEFIVSNQYYGHGAILSLNEAITLRDKLNEIIQRMKEASDQ